MSENVDLRVYKTNQIIQYAFIQLLGEKSFEEITVQNILDRAFVNRKTFYNHFQDKYDLADQMIEKALNIVSGDVLKYSDDGEPVDYFSLANIRRNELMKNRKMILSLWNVRTEKRNFQKELREKYEDSYIQLAEFKNHNEGNVVYQSKLFSAVALETLQQVLENKDVNIASRVLEEFKSMGDLIEQLIIM